MASEAQAGERMEMRYVGMWDTWVIMWNDTTKEYYALPMEKGYERIMTANLDNIGRLITDQKQAKRANKEIWG